MKKEEKIKNVFEYCDNFKVTEKDKDEISDYVNILIKESIELQENIKIKNIVNLLKNLELLKGNNNDNKKNS